MTLRFFSLCAAALALALPALAQETRLNDLHIDSPYARATAPQQPAGGAFVTIENKGKTADALVGASSPVAKSVEIHTMSMEGNVMKMREVGRVDIKAGERIEMKPGDGYHLMLMGLKQPLKSGDTIPMTLVFEKAGKTDVKVMVRDAASMHGGMHHKH